ncbi:MAG TPA: LytR C-terminal domain-containing protein, partial [Actinomycetota bacterium]|nr:LytR C-terminal domain-containing protein [Actinomycetota bacterium]
PTPPAATAPPGGQGNDGEGAQQGDGGGNGGQEDVSIQVLNATDESGLAEDTAEFIESSLGYSDVVFGDASTDQDTTTIHFASGFRQQARTLRNELYREAVLQGGTAGDAAVDITVVLGRDYVEAN